MAQPTDQPLRIGVLIAGAALVMSITYLRFCGSLSIPDKPAAPEEIISGSAGQLLSDTTASPSAYKDFLQRDAAIAGVRTPTIEEMSRKLAYHVDESRQGYALELGKPPIERAGLRLHVERSGDAIVLVIQNLLDSDVAYDVVTRPSGGSYGCNAAPALPFNAMVIARHGSETRTECVWHDGETIIVSKVETVEVPPLSAWYLSEVPPQLVGIEDRIARGHRAPDTKEPCSPTQGAAVRGAMDQGKIGWRDLVDFYARHRCQTYQFPLYYRAFTQDGERPLPALD